MTMMTNEERLEHNNFITQINERKHKIRVLLEDFEYRLQANLTKPRTEENYQRYLESLKERDQVLALLAELCSCSFSVPPEPTFDMFLEMNYQRFDYEKEFAYDGVLSAENTLL